MGGHCAHLSDCTWYPLTARGARLSDATLLLAWLTFLWSAPCPTRRLAGRGRMSSTGLVLLLLPHQVLADLRRCVAHPWAHLWRRQLRLLSPFGYVATFAARCVGTLR